MRQKRAIKNKHQSTALQALVYRKNQHLHTKDPKSSKNILSAYFKVCKKEKSQLQNEMYIKTNALIKGT